MKQIEDLEREWRELVAKHGSDAVESTCRLMSEAAEHFGANDSIGRGTLHASTHQNGVLLVFLRPGAQEKSINLSHESARQLLVWLAGHAK